MLESELNNVVKESADLKRVNNFLTQLRATAANDWLKKANIEEVRALVSLFSGSEVMSERLIANPEWISEIFNLEKLKHKRESEGLNYDINQQISPLIEMREFSKALSLVRIFKQKEMLRIAVRDLSGLASIEDILEEISSLADVCLDSVYEILWAQLTERYGVPYYKDFSGKWIPTGFAVIGLGKLGGKELNYSSDIDVIFVYTEEGKVFSKPPDSATDSTKGMMNHQFFIRLAEAFVSEVSNSAPEGRLYRIDLRLRPEGKAGALARSLESYENFYAQYGQTWERMMLIKARGVAGNQQLAHEFIETIQPFRFPRSVSERVLNIIAEMKERIENEVVKSGELNRNIKLGRGGIREIEFIVQMHQLIYGGKIPFIQEANTLACLRKLSMYDLMPREETNALEEAYCFLRKLEHRLQMEQELQTHTLPTDKEYRHRLAKLMGFNDVKTFTAELRSHTSTVRNIYRKYFKIKKTKRKLFYPDTFDGKEQEWIEILKVHKFREPAQALKILKEFVNGPGYVHIPRRTIEAAMSLVIRLLQLCPSPYGDSENIKIKRLENVPGPVKRPILSDPDRVVARLDNFVSVYGARSILYETFEANPSFFELLLLLFDRSEFLAETAIRTPDLVEDLVLTGRLNRSKSAEEVLEELNYGLNDEDQYLWLRKYHQAERMRIGLRDILGLADFDQCLLELSALAEACLQYASEVIFKKYKFTTPPFCIIGMGKLGGQEIDYGSDLDVVFVAPTGVVEIHKLQPVAAEIMDLLNRSTAEGIVFKIDARLRPDGEKGLLVNTIDAYEEYYRKRAQLWEIQSLTRSRAVAGDLKTGDAFQLLARSLTNFKTPSLPLSAYKENWKEEIMKMRERIEKERTPNGKEDIAIKTGAGGLMDAEFIAQTLCLEQGWYEPNTLCALKKAQSENVITDAETLIENYNILRRIEGILRRWSYEGEVMLPDDPAPFYRVSVRCGYSSPEEFREAVKNCRSAIRTVYKKYFNLD
ncbi:MAG TPA: bifunctional [glutamate--ammonia ligase]-adenylyl-L-tyrosine phosphorylase/[glutamate--ammonia-ligase] adenylyltransferase [Verrucomicrobiota bacterium]|mgnify:CR=1 FL=1|nr:bifunctional [glutamate--ammonia ligase]-adenylyl-L-tyrosine phosphorylase/[glutamate--ammonia-ligase] adenylyltransferase [Verrucomicrobiota bacterium]